LLTLIYKMTQSLNNKIALVTGASRGIGAGIARCFAQAGAHVIIVDLPQQAALAESVIQEINGVGRKAIFIAADVSDAGQIKTAVERAYAEFGALDIVVANAAFSIRQTTLDLDWQDFRRTIEVTELGAVHTCKAAADQMVAHARGGAILIIGSITADMALPSMVAYTMSKAAVHHYGRALADELAPRNIRVNVIAPGWIDTPGERLHFSEAELQAAGKRIPRGRLGTPEDIGRAAVFLCSDAADYITGTILTVDGGYRGAMRLP
jgi:glucose 1-dehydrogenase